MRIISLFTAMLLAWGPALAGPDGLKRCRLPGLEHQAWCGHILRPLDPAAPAGRQIELHYAVLPALARNKKPDPVFFFAGGPGQSAIELAGSVARVLTRVSNRRDIVLIDQRGTGRSAPLRCAADSPTRPLQEMADPALRRAELQACRKALEALPHGDLRQYTTSIAMADVDALRSVLGASQINLVGGSYGTRAALEYQRQFPQHVRRAVLDGVAPPDMVLPASFSADAQAAFDELLRSCEADPACRQRYPSLREQWRSLLASLPREVQVPHPVTGRVEGFTLTRDLATAMLRMPLYQPSLASALPLALSEASAGRFTALVGLASAMGGARQLALAQGMHFSVVCSEDMPLLEQAKDRPGADLGDGFLDTYRQACASWPRGAVPPAFYRLPSARNATLLLSGGADPATPARHGQRVAQALGAMARHVVVAQAGHGVMQIGCMRDLVYRFIDAETDAAALALDAACAAAIPRPPVFAPVAGKASP